MYFRTNVDGFLKSVPQRRGVLALAADNIHADCRLRTSELQAFSSQSRQKRRASKSLEAPCARCRYEISAEVQHLVQSVKSASTRSGSSQTRAGDDDRKYFAQKYRLVSRFNATLPLSRQAWFSISPEEISKHFARRVVCLSRKLGRKIRVFDPFCGAGGNIVQLALKVEVSHAFASDIDAGEVDCAKRMAALYGVPEQKIAFKVRKFFDFDASTFRTPVDAILCGSPWGGPAYLKGVYDLDAMIPEYGRILRHCAKFTGNLGLVMPENLSADQLVQTSSVIPSPQCIELELNFLAGKMKTVYYGGSVNNDQ